MKTKRTPTGKRSEAFPAKYNKLKIRILIFFFISGSICSSCNPDDETDGTSGATSSSLIACANRIGINGYSISLVFSIIGIR